MKTLAFLCLGLLVHLASAQTFTVGFSQKEYCAVEGEEFTFCIVATMGEAPSAFSVTVNGVYRDGSATLEESIDIPAGYDDSEEPLCVTKAAVDNDCLDDGNYIDLTLTVDAGSPNDVGVADDCDEAHVSVFDDDVIEYEVSQDIVYVDEGASSAMACITLSCVDGPTKRCSPVLFHVPEVDGLAELQKKIALIPLGIENDGQVCCEIELESGFDVPAGQFVEVSFTVKSEDLNVQGKGVVSGIIRVNDTGLVPPTDDPGVDDIFENYTPMVTGDTVFIDLIDTIDIATCSLNIAAAGTTNCAGIDGNVGSLTTGRNTRLTLNVLLSGGLSLTRTFRMDGANDICDSHLINGGITGSGTNFEILFEGTGPDITGAMTVTDFTCIVAGSSAGTPVLVPSAPCTSHVPYSFTIPEPLDCFYVIVQPVPGGNPDCDRNIRQPFKYPH